MKAPVLAALAWLATTSVPFADAADRSKPPSPGPVRPLRLPTLEKRSLANGVPVIVATMDEVPVVDVVVAVRAGASVDPEDKPGAALLTADMLDEGASGKGALELEDALDYLGASVTTGAGWDSASARLHVPVARLGEALPLLADVMLRPDFPETDFKRLRSELLTDFLQSRDEARDIASAALARAVFGAQHRYGTPVRGTAASVQALSRNDLAALHKAHYSADQAVIVAVGAVKADSLLPLLERAFGSWAKAAGSTAPAVAPPAVLRGPSLVLVDKPESGQSAVRFGAPGPDRQTPLYYDLEVMNTLLGGSFTSRLNDNLREQHGYAYGASSSFDFRRSGGLFVAGADVQTDKTGPALGEFMKELQRIRTPVTAEEADRARNYAALGYASEVETTRQVATKLVNQWIYRLPDDAISAYVPRALAVTVTQIEKAATASVDPSKMALVVVGDRKAIEAPLRALKHAPLTILGVDDVLGPPPKVE